MTEAISQATEYHFDASLDDATHKVIAEFEWMGLPEGEQLGSLMVEINDALTQIMAPWK